MSLNNQNYYTFINNKTIPIVFIHGVGLDRNMWSPQINFFRKYSTLTYDANRTEYVGGYPSNEPFEKAWVSFNDIERFNRQKASYFRTIQPSTYHSRVPTKHIYNYSFCLKPEAIQPSGSCNFSRMKDCKLEFENITSDDTELFVFATNYNILAIHAGMGGLKYSN